MATVANANWGLYFEGDQLGRDLEWVKVVDATTDDYTTADYDVVLGVLHTFMSITILGTPKANGFMIGAEGIGETAANMQAAIRVATGSAASLVTIETLGGDAAGIAFA